MDGQLLLLRILLVIFGIIIIILALALRHSISRLQRLKRLKKLSNRQWLHREEKDSRDFINALVPMAVGLTIIVDIIKKSQEEIKP